MKISNKIIHKATHEAEKNKSIFYVGISKIEIYNTHAKAYTPDRVDEEGNHQPILLINSDREKLPREGLSNYLVLVIAGSASRYGEAVGILVRRSDFSTEKNTFKTKII